MQTSYRTLETSQIYKIVTKINKKTSQKKRGLEANGKKMRLVALNRFICNKYIKVRSKWHEETSSNEWDELGNDCTCQKNRHRPVLVKANYGHSSWKAWEWELKSSLCQENCVYMEECNTHSIRPQSDYCSHRPIHHSSTSSNLYLCIYSIIYI